MTTPYHSAHLFPIPFTRGFTTVSPHVSLPNPQNITHVSLSDEKSLQIVKNTKGTSHPLVTVNSTEAWRATYPEGSINPSGAIKGGFGFYLEGPDYMGWEDAREVMLSYAVYFEPEFDFQLGGKLPGLFGGASLEDAYGCSGGRSEGRDKCFSLRLMWRADGLGELYAYLPLVPVNDEVLLKIPPLSKRNPDYGFSVGRGSWQFTAGQWSVLAVRVRLNDLDVPNGLIEVFVDGKSVILAEGVVVRAHADTTCRGGHVQTFFGGSSTPYASPKDQSAFFAGVSGAVV